MDLTEIAKPVSPDDVCGPDLDVEGDAQFSQFMARAGYFLPTVYFERRPSGELVAFDRTTIDFKAEFRTLEALLKRTRDLRLLSVTSRLMALDRQFADCARCLDLVADLLAGAWEEIHPRGEDGDYGYRSVVLQEFDDLPSMIMPLQHLPLFQHRRFGPISYRTFLVTTEAAPPRDSETVLDRSELERALLESDPEMREEAQAAARIMAAAVARIGELTAERMGDRNAVRLAHLGELAHGILRFLSPVEVIVEAPEVPKEVAESPAPQRAGPVATAAQAAAALAAVADYFQRSEPSSPAELLVRQARRLIGLPFSDMLRTLLPNHADEATLYIGPKPESSFELRIDHMMDVLGRDGASPDRQDVSAPEAGFTVESRAVAVALLKEVSTFYRASEPSSPIPLFTDRACTLVNRDFLSILADVLPGIRLSRDGD
ncbi:ImpA family type VI secretion system protein [Methylobacterium longum]|uniref:Type VI secretion system ImpA family N-terminal domain-containing protein n=1 Tax=Methylobacterium longum TaxID=767694 RepID=A0ABT8ATS6_9HYPH|nr:type VI secretion system ImpA family N-terminal domain-containing protein [Methylobacterium longum]MDN3573347.1 type VI secretion system ImpA family N-terminal domain-containing protein [Methylobacterium longum]